MILSQQIEQWLEGSYSKIAAFKRPFVTLSYAQSWDGSITINAGESLALSGEESTRLTHHLRSLHDGILVGVGTVIADNPQLTVRECAGPSPQPIVLDSHLRIPATARLCHSPGKRCWILTSQRDDGMCGDGIEIFTLQGDADGRVSLIEALNALWDKGIRRLMVEGGANVITAFIKAQLADAVVLTVAPTIVGGYKAVNNLGIATCAQLPRISPLHTERCGDDLIMWGNFQYHERTS